MMVSSDSKAIVVLCTAPADGGHAIRLARGLVESRLAACVNIVANVRSIYRWDGVIQEDTEAQLVIKSRSERFDELVAWLNDNHPYDVPEVLALPVVAGAPEYLSWLAAETTSPE